MSNFKIRKVYKCRRCGSEVFHDFEEVYHLPRNIAVRGAIDGVLTTHACLYPENFVKESIGICDLIGVDVAND